MGQLGTLRGKNENKARRSSNIFVTRKYYKNETFGGISKHCEDERSGNCTAFLKSKESSDFFKVHVTKEATEAVLHTRFIMSNGEARYLRLAMIQRVSLLLFCRAVLH